MKLALKPLSALLAIPLVFSSGMGIAAATQPSEAPVPEIDYPDTRRGDVVDEMFGQMIADPYRWLETDAKGDRDVAAWVGAQNEVTEDYLATLPGRELFRERLTALLDHEQVSAPDERDGRYFYLRLSGQENQAVLMVRDGVAGDDRVLIDPNAWSEDGTVALAEWAASEDGSSVAYAVQESGSDWRTIKVLDVATGRGARRRCRVGPVHQYQLDRGWVRFFLRPLPPAGRGDGRPSPPCQPRGLFPRHWHAANGRPAGIRDA